MSFLFIMPNHIERVNDENGVLKTLRLNCTELEPRTFNINLIKQPASVLQQFERYVAAKQPVMVPVKEGTTTDGSAYFQLLPGQIIPVSLDYVKELQAQQAPSIPSKQ